MCTLSFFFFPPPLFLPFDFEWDGGLSAQHACFCLCIVAGRHLLRMRPRDTSAPELARYVIGEYLGAGSTGTVFEVIDAVTRKPYVLKQISLESIGDEEKLRARKEILVMNGVDHPNIVKFRESFSGANSVNIVMEHCASTLEELIERQRAEGGQPFPEDVIIEWMAELLCALAYLHSRSIVHRDLKTSNIFLTEKNHVKLGDFGVCTVLTSTSVAAHSMIGTPLYFSPEVCAEEDYDERSDVWSLGVVFYEMCTLRHPFEAEHLPGLIQQILTKEVAPFNTGLDARFEEIVRGMLKKDPRDRPTAQDLIDNHLVVPVSHPSHPSQKPSRGRLIQQYYGPEFACRREKKSPWPPSDERILGEEAKVKQKARAPLPSPPQEQHPRKHDWRPSAVAGGAPSRVKGGNQVVTNRKNLGKGAGKELSPEERVAAMKRIKGAKSKINMAELRQNMLRKRFQLFGGIKAPSTDDVPVVIELQQSLQSARTGEAAPEDLPAGSPTMRPKSRFIEDIAAVFELHSAGGVQIALEELEDAASLLCQYKLTNYGLC
ncbi:putative serine/threonine-protein kinase Nek1, putative,protein kinase [Trypanosoma conorhini]|uniref:non-specific serine/threonine protein kinase n=1 Tax=Trypanosoma conorhini TaxID=83891 RepID=A0A3S5ITN9_9TRYP|nr:putative serine/threonine-protein kinase Nek1, putative,protein kinase [Trypanosoma conorhini]RNF22455.1 putative serine/threonine-protein kinase Nek1, putative,protein kinase [Trypanosoma conorhini]